MVRISEQNNFIYFTLSLVLILVIAAVVKEIAGAEFEFLLKPVLLNSFVICLLSMKFSQKWYLYLVTISVLMTGVIVIHTLFGSELANTLMLILMLGFFYGVFHSTAHNILLSDHIDNNKLIGSIALFLVMGLSWAALYLLILEINPNAILGVEPANSWGGNFSEMTYFSFVTLTTLGYGDYSPNSPLAEVVVYLEAIMGVFYMAVVVSGLVNARKK